MMVVIEWKLRAKLKMISDLMQVANNSAIIKLNSMKNVENSISIAFLIYLNLKRV